MADKRDKLIKDFLEKVIVFQEENIREENQSRAAITRRMTSFIDDKLSEAYENLDENN